MTTLKVSKAIGWTIVAVVAVCVLGVLILPQVDLPDFVLNSAGYRIGCLDHVNLDAFSCDAPVSILISPDLFQHGRNDPRNTSILERANLNLELKKIASLRC